MELFLSANRKLVLTVALAFVAVMLLPASAYAQATISTGSIQGAVTDPSGAVVSNAKVSITNKGTGQQLVKTTSESGTYNSGPLTSGTYTIRVERDGFQTTEITLPVQVGVTSPGNVRLTVGSSNQVVEVTGEAIRVNTEQPTVQGVLTATQIEQLPIAGRNFLDLAQLEPGVQIQDGGTFDPTKNGFSSISFGGRYGRTARIAVDGIDVSDETVGTTTQNISAGAISEFQLSQSTLDMSTELTSSGAVNVVTKSGTNSLHGEGFYLFRDDEFFANFPGGLDLPYQRNHFGGSLGGPIWQNRLFFFANAERIKQDWQLPLVPPSPFTNLPNSYGANFRDTQTLGRLDWQATNNLKLFYKFTYNFNEHVSAFGQTYQPFASKNNTPSHGVGADFTTGNFTHSVRFGFLNFQNKIVDAVVGNAGLFNPGAAAGVAIRIGPAGTVTRFGPSRLAPQGTIQTNHQIKYDGSKLHGSHIFRYGISYNRIRGGGYASFYGIAPEIRTSIGAAAQADADAGPFPGGRTNPLNYPISSVLMGNGQGFFTEEPAFGFPAGGQKDNRLGIYFGDTWKIRPNFTLTAGLRWQRDTGRTDSDLAEITCDQIDTTLFPNPPCTGSQRILDQFGPGLGDRVNQPNTNFSPQVGFAWDPWNNGKTVIRGGAGIYYENAVFNNVLFDRPGRLTQGLFWGTASPCPSGELQLPTGVVSSVTLGGTTYNLADVCAMRVGEAMGVIGQLQQFYQAQVAAAGAQANPNFIGANLANGDNSTGNNFLAPNYKTPRSYQMNLGFQHEVRQGSIISVDFIRNVGLRYLLGVDTNHVGDARYLNAAAAQNAIAETNAAFGCATVACAIGEGATIGDYAAHGLDSGNVYLAGFPAQLFGLTPATGAAFAGINPNVGENIMLFPVGRSAYTALQVKYTQNLRDPMPGVSGGFLQVSYSRSRFNTMTDDQDFVNSAYDYRNATRFFGPGSLDRTHQLSFGGSIDTRFGPRFSFAAHIFSPLAQTPLIENQFREGEIFFTDLNGDGNMSLAGEVLPGANVGSYGRDLTPSNINDALNNYNSTIAGTLTPAGQALVSAGLMTADELIALGAVADSVPLAPPDQANLDWMKSIDLKMSWPIRIREGMSLEPSVGFYNLFNFANFDSPSTLMSGVLTGSGGHINGTPKRGADRDSNRIGTGSGVNTSGSARQIEFGLRFVF